MSAAALDGRASDGERASGRALSSSACTVPGLALPQERSDEDQERSDPSSAGGALGGSRARRDVSRWASEAHLT